MLGSIVLKEGREGESYALYSADTSRPARRTTIHLHSCLNKANSSFACQEIYQTITFDLYMET